MAGSRSGEGGQQIQKGDERGPASPRPETEPAPSLEVGPAPARLLADGYEGQVDLLSKREIPTAQRQQLATQIGRVQGNRHLQRVIEGVARRLQEPETPIARDPWDDLLEQEMSIPGSPGPATIPPDLLQSVDLDTFSDDQLCIRLDRIQDTLIGVAQISPETQFLQEQATQIQQLQRERQVENAVRQELEDFLQEFQNITVTVTWGEDTGTQSVMHSEEVAVHPPYFMNVRDRSGAHPRTLQRYDAAQAHRRAADRATRQLLNEISRREGRRGGMGAASARVGKSSPDEIRRILERALDRNLIQAGAGQDHPNSQDLRNWLIRYGIGIDCSGFVSQALNRVITAMGGESEGLRLGSRGLRGGNRRFERISDPTQLRPGDTMYKPGHIRIITSVSRESGDVVFSTAESRAGGSDDPGGDQADVGPASAQWRYHNGQLERRSRTGAWIRSGEQPIFGRYRRLATAMEGAAGTGAGTP